MQKEEEKKILAIISIIIQWRINFIILVLTSIICLITTIHISEEGPT